MGFEEVPMSFTYPTSFGLAIPAIPCLAVALNLTPDMPA